MEVTPVKREKLYDLIISTLKPDREMTARELSTELWKLGFLVTPTRQEVAPRLTELEHKHIVEVCNTERDKKTKKCVSLYK